MRNLKSTLAAACLVTLLPAGPAFAQGEDSTPTERDVLVLAELLTRVYDNYNQVYFDQRIGYPENERHDRIELRVDRVGGPDSMLLAFREFSGGDYSALTRAGALALSPDNERGASRMEVWNRPVAGLDPMAEGAGVSERPEAPPDCVVYWTREAAQFRGEAEGGCAAWADKSLLGEQQLWLDAPGGRDHPGGTYKLHAARMMSCYIDIPGVSGGRDEEYKRYDNLQVHDRGGGARITHTDGRQIGLRLSNVDWPLNNYSDVFTRDVLVLYVLEYLEDGITSHGYVFAEPDTERIGINLYWMLSYCYMESNKNIRPFM
ncbi:MAG: hypothetical protein F4109_05310 [Gammaproteobacteria bacterium]|nr:hypothetical protein [Gammaproteobacteria bacterium]MYD02367.1 hypothetical protein [Gammaproteobacteria bacterium]MYI24831.1 hypothetical protein [Gammaproteobacteria bacterium]